MSTSQTKIAWTDRTWNPTRGCSLVSPGCTNCYAMKIAHRFNGKGQPYEGLTRMTEYGHGPVWNGKIREVADDALTAPSSWKKPARIFVNSMSDLFHEGVRDDFIADVFDVMIHSPQHTFQVLTKRPHRMREWMGANFPLPPFNVWLGVSVENRATADERIPILMETPAAVRFLSVEPLLEHVDLCLLARWPRPDWVIIGGESGPNARPCNVIWIRSILNYCRAAEVPAFVKQIGARPFAPPCTSACATIHGSQPKDRHGGDPAEWPEDLRVREFPR